MNNNTTVTSHCQEALDISTNVFREAFKKAGLNKESIERLNKNPEFESELVQIILKCSSETILGAGANETPYSGYWLPEKR